MGQYTAKRRIDYDRTYQAGEPIELDDATAKPLLDTGAIEVADPKAKFQDAVAKAESAARELEQAGGDPSAAARELKERAQDAMRALDDAIDEVAKAVGAGLLSAADAARQVCEQVAGADPVDVQRRIEEQVKAQREEAPARGKPKAQETKADKKTK